MMLSLLGAGLGAASLGALGWGTFQPNCGLFGPAIGRGPGDGPVFPGGLPPRAARQVSQSCRLPDQNSDDEFRHNLRNTNPGAGYDYLIKIVPVTASALRRSLDSRAFCRRDS